MRTDFPRPRALNGGVIPMFVCGAGAWGFWWIVPLVGGLICLGLMVMAFRTMTAGRGGMCCTGGHRHGAA